jgi:hypothetical protein
MQANLLHVVEVMDAYLQNLKKRGAESKDREDIEKIEKIVGEIRQTVQSWESQGANSSQKQRFVLKLKELAATVTRSSLSEAARQHLLVLDDDLKPLSASGKNCKAPLMLLTVGS